MNILKIKVPTIFGVGTDIQQVSRIDRFFTGNQYKMDAFLNRVFHSSEIETFHSKSEGAPRLQFLASRWALREALVKASGETRLHYPNIYLYKPPKIDRKTKPILKVDGDRNREFLFD